jgi:uncharacterized membrane protein (UPF0127 family)
MAEVTSDLMRSAICKHLHCRPGRGENQAARPTNDVDLVIARSPVARLRGLIGRRDVALLLPRCRSVHTFGMRFALDLVWLDGGGRVVRIDRGVPPWRVRSCRAARCVLELPSPEGDGGDPGDDDRRACEPPGSDGLARDDRRGGRGHDDARLP